MTETSKILTLFSKVFYNTKLNLNDEELSILLEKIKKYETSNSYEEYAKNHNLDRDKLVKGSIKQDVLNDFLNLKQLILNEFYNFKNNVLKYEKNDFKITTSWISKSLKGNRGEYHNHNNCMYSGIFYIQVNENSGGISFEDFSNRRFLLENTENNIYNCKEIIINPTKNTLIFFPSEVYHKVLLNNSNIDRYAIAFNLMPIGNIGREDSYFKI